MTVFASQQLKGAYAEGGGPIIQTLGAHFGEVAVCSHQNLCMYCWLIPIKVQGDTMIVFCIVGHLHTTVGTSKAAMTMMRFHCCTTAIRVCKACGKVCVMATMCYSPNSSSYLESQDKITNLKINIDNKNNVTTTVINVNDDDDAC